MLSETTSVTRQIASYLLTFVLAFGALVLYLRALERSILRNPAGFSHAFIVFLLPAGLLGLLPTGISQAPDWTLWVSLGIFGALAIYRFIRTAMRVGRLHRSTNGGAWKPEPRDPPPSG